MCVRRSGNCVSTRRKGGAEGAHGPDCGFCADVFAFEYYFLDSGFITHCDYCDVGWVGQPRYSSFQHPDVVSTLSRNGLQGTRFCVGDSDRCQEVWPDRVVQEALRADMSVSQAERALPMRKTGDGGLLMVIWFCAR